MLRRRELFAGRTGRSRQHFWRWNGADTAHLEHQPLQNLGFETGRRPLGVGQQ